MRSAYFPSQSTLPGKRMHYTVFGDPDNPNVVICAHGLTRNGRDFDRLAEVLAADFRVLCPDAPGRGLSDWLDDPGSYNYGTYTSLALEWLHSECFDGCETLSWVGTSMGGILGMLVAGQGSRPSISRLVLNDIGYKVPKSGLERLATYVGVQTEFASVGDWERYLRRVSAGFGPLSDADWRHLAVHSCVTHGNGTVSPAYDPAIAGAFQGPVQAVDLSDAWQAVCCPVLLVRGASSDILTADIAAAMTSREQVDYLEIPDTGHAPMFMNATDIQRLQHYLRDAG